MADHPLTKYWAVKLLNDGLPHGVAEWVYLASEVEARIAHFEARYQELHDVYVLDQERAYAEVGELRKTVEAQAQHLEALQRQKEEDDSTRVDGQ